MNAANIQLDMNIRESSSKAPQRIEAAGKDSSFEKALKKAKDETASQDEVSSDQNAAKAEQADLSKSEKKEIKEDRLIKELAEKKNPEEKGKLKNSEEVNIKGLLVKNAEESVPEENAVDLKEVLVKETAEKSKKGKEAVVAEDIKADNSATVQEEPLLAAKTSLKDVAETDQKEINSKKKTKKTGEDDVISVLVSGQKASLSENTALAQGAVAEMTTDLKSGLKTGTNLDEKISVVDLRTATAETDSAEKLVGKVTEQSLVEGNVVTPTGNPGEVTMNLGAKSSVPATMEGTKGSQFYSMLTTEIQNSAEEFVKNGSIILRDGNAGTINLILHPEELGNVKISLELHDKMISAQIKVASEEAYQAFKDSIASLKQAFAESGFDTGSFDLSWAGQGQQQQQGNHSYRQQEIAFSDTLYGEMLREDEGDGESEVHILQKNYSDSSQIAVNIMA
ncbi:MAG: flagellar hook-length control protein FliK [Candidatus Treponema excrementipullorum]|nr:flagellar hook-length control protein FliK [Spirochaetia bacterium]MDY2755176.1 flagellar hook-length control protein FliK [Candidatus Treponema excrementipullorum]